ncbi:MAG: hypothetical protein HY852_10510 [Bradyrhizobium sp.]|uniref:hypothetical protein n=1 Tax=Bradyrhizobium sp. TaxID=376 RepID=UPI0025C44027|nr:hypothetical protein [Bradyrhizobium sp.]MBI5262232.1 hypothetical protein [Bradyrhizobium sp.]
MDEAAALIAIHTLRTSPVYQQAERIRRKTDGGAATMAKAADDTDEAAALHLLVSTWETIATILEGVENKDRIFEVTPVCHMHRNLKDSFSELGLKHARLRSADEFNVPNGGYGAKFSKLANDYDNWLLEKQKSAQYISGACDGMYACFG